jgi:hypothetical protein
MVTVIYAVHLLSTVGAAMFVCSTILFSLGLIRQKTAGVGVFIGMLLLAVAAVLTFLIGVATVLQ